MQKSSLLTVLVYVPCLVQCHRGALVQTSEKGKATLAMIQSRGSSNGTLSAAVSAAAAGDDIDARDWADMYEDYLDAELEEDEEIESYYFSSAAGRARVVLGNRRWGEGGYMRAGEGAHCCAVTSNSAL